MRRPRSEATLDVWDAIRGRRSIRQYTTSSVSRELLSQLIDAAIQAPSAVNEQLWHFTVVTNRAALDNIAAKSKAYMLEDVAEQPDHFRQTLSDPNFQIFYHAPALIVISAPAGASWAVEDCALAAENLMLAAYALGLGSCWIGFTQRWLDTDDGRTTLGLAQSERVVAPLIIGHPKVALAPVTRRKPRIQWRE